ncbi:upf0544 protein c5orf45 homolog [Nannochloropsis oceanica]
MPTFVLVQCYRCHVFIPNQETKNRKWACRMCGAKQSIIKVYARTDSAKELRLAAQQLNAQHGEARDQLHQQRSMQVPASPPLYECYQGGGGEEGEVEEELRHHNNYHLQNQHQMSGSADGSVSQEGNAHGGGGGGGEVGSRWGAFLIDTQREDAQSSISGNGFHGASLMSLVSEDMEEEDGRFVTELPAARERGKIGRGGRGGGGGKSGRHGGRRKRGGGEGGSEGKEREENWGHGRQRQARKRGGDSNNDEEDEEAMRIQEDNRGYHKQHLQYQQHQQHDGWGWEASMGETRGEVGRYETGGEVSKRMRSYDAVTESNKRHVSAVQGGERGRGGGGGGAAAAAASSNRVAISSNSRWSAFM